MNKESTPIELRLLTLLQKVREEHDGEARVELNNLLRSDAAARKAMTAALVNEQALIAHLRDQSIVSILKPETAAPLPARSRRWFQWGPAMAAAAGIVFGMFCTSVVFGYVMPRVAETVRHTLAVANAGFEQDAAPLPDGVPVQFGVWSGDYAENVGAQQGIVPHEGKRMLRFLRSDSAVSRGAAGGANGNIYQVVDLRPYRNEIADGKATVDWSAWFDCIPGADGKGMKFMAGIWSFTGDTSILPVNWSQHLYLETAKSSRSIQADADSHRWQRVAGSMIVPSDTDFLVVELKAIPGEPAPPGAAYAFPGAYADDVQLVLRRGGGSQTATSLQVTR